MKDRTTNYYPFEQVNPTIRIHLYDNNYFDVLGLPDMERYEIIREGLIARGRHLAIAKRRAINDHFQKVSAIKMVRAAMNIGLKESKLLVEMLVEMLIEYGMEAEREEYRALKQVGLQGG